MSLAATIFAYYLMNEALLDSHVTTADEQARLTPDEVLQQFKEGNMRFQSGSETRRNHSGQVRKSASGQFPKAMVLSCLDSRLPAEDVFDQGIGDVFVGRVAGKREQHPPYLIPHTPGKSDSEGEGAKRSDQDRRGLLPPRRWHTRIHQLKILQPQHS